MKAHKVVLMAAALLLVAGCSDEVSTGPRPEAAVAPANPGFIDPDADVQQFQAGGDNWTIAVSRGSDGAVTRTSILKNGAAFAAYNGYVGAGSSGTVDASVYDAGQPALTSDIMVSRESSTMDQMSLDVPCQAQLEAFALATATLGWRVAQYRVSPTFKNRALVVGAAIAVFTTGAEAYECLSALRQQG